MDKIFVEYSSANGIFFQHRALDREYVVKPACHAHLEIVYVIKGKLELDIGGQKREVGDGELILIDSNVMHSQRMIGGLQTELLCVNFLPNVLPSIVKYEFVRLVSESPVLMHCLPKDVVEQYNVLEQLNLVGEIAKKEDISYKDLYISAELIKLVCLISQAVDKLIGVEHDKKFRASKTVVLSKCLDYLNSNLTKKINIENIADYLCCSKSYLQHFFKKEMGVTISEYINTQKLTIARSLLVSNNSPSEVADKLGFEYYSTFSAKFKKFYGVSPKSVPVEAIAVNLDIEKKNVKGGNEK